MRFLGKAWRLLVGVKDGLVLLFMLIFFGLLYLALSADPHAGSSERGALLLDLSGAIVEQPVEASPLDVLGGAPMTREYRLRDIVHALERAATDERIEAVVLDLDIFTGGGQTALANVGAALDGVRRAGKPVLAYAVGYSDDGYQLAAHASEVWLNPLGGVLVTGPGGTNLYYKDLLDKIGVTANVYRAGTYKAAVEPYTRNDMSPESREATQAVADSLWETWQQDVRQARPKAKLAAHVAAPEQGIAAAGGDMAKAALAAGLVDKLGDRSAFDRRVAELVGTSSNSDAKRAYKAVHYDAWVDDNPSSDMSGAIGVITVAGEIVDGEAGPGTAGAETIAATLDKGIKANNLKALVVRVDSPGGSTLASERIRQAVIDAKATGLPVIISMGSVAASGGYWIATAGDHILAEPSTITGSIGVYGVLPSFEGALSKLGIGADGVKTTPLSGEPDLLRGPSPQANALIQSGVDSTYRRFIGLVSAARKLPPERVDAIAQGRIWDGGTARQLGLVDGFGSLPDAVREAARRAKIDPDTARPLFLEEEPSFFASMFGSLADDETEAASSDAFSRLAAHPQHLLARAIDDARRILAGPAIQARCLECPSTSLPRLGREERTFGEFLLALLAR